MGTVPKATPTPITPNATIDTHNVLQQENDCRRDQERKEEGREEKKKGGREEKRKGGRGEKVSKPCIPTTTVRE